MTLTPSQLADLARSLKDNEAYNTALDRIRDNALEGLVKAKPTDTESITQFQATVRVVDELRENIDHMSGALSPKKNAGIA